MTEVSEIEAGGEVRTIKDTTARQQIQSYIEEEPIKITATVTTPGIANNVFYYKLKRKLKILIGGSINPDGLLASFQLPEGESFNIGAWGTAFAVTLRSPTSGLLSTGIAIINKVDKTYKITVFPYIAGQNEVRILNEDITELPSN